MSGLATLLHHMFIGIEIRRYIIGTALLLLAIFLPLANPASASDGVWNTLQASGWYLPLPNERRPVARIYVTEIGKGPTVVVLHGGFGDDFAYLVDAFEPLFGKYHFVFYDQRGSLRSPVKNDDYAKYVSFQAHINDLEALRKALGQKQLLIVAHSMGTLIAQAYLAQHPNAVRGLVLLGSVPPKLENGDSLDAFIKAANHRSDLMWRRAAVIKEIKAQKLFNGPYTPKQNFEHNHIIEAGANIVDIGRWRHYYINFYNQAAANAASKTVPNHYDFVGRIKQCECKVTIIDGDHDYVDPSGRLWAKASVGLDNVTVDVLKDAGHSAWIDDPTDFTTDVENALDRSFKH